MCRFKVGQGLVQVQVQGGAGFGFRATVVCGPLWKHRAWVVQVSGGVEWGLV